MPPKGWRKNADGQYPEPKDDGPVSIDDLLFPRSTIQKLAKLMVNVSDSNMLIAKDSLLALQRSATVFVSHIMFHARQISKEQDRKGINSQDIMGAIERADFNGFIPEVRDRLASFEQAQAARKADKKEQKALAESNIDENAAKKQKDNDLAAITKTVNESDNEEELDAEVDDTNDKIEQQEDTEMAEPEEGNEETRNPLEILGEDEKELGGADVEAPAVEDSDGEGEDI